MKKTQITDTMPLTPLLFLKKDKLKESLIIIEKINKDFKKFFNIKNKKNWIEYQNDKNLASYYISYINYYIEITDKELNNKEYKIE